MSQDRLGPLVRALVGVDRNHLGVMTDIANRFNSADAPRWNERLKGIVQEGLPPLEPPPPLLVFDDEHIAPVNLSEVHYPATFWCDTDETPARRIWGSFATTVVANAKPREPSGVKVRYAGVSRATTVREILTAPGVGDFNPTDLSAVIAEMVGKQPHGEAGDLLTDGRGNLFTCGSVLVRVGWDAISRYWFVDDWAPGFGVYASRRVFSGNLKL